MSAYYCIECDEHKDDDFEKCHPHPASYAHCMCTGCAIREKIICGECEEMPTDENPMVPHPQDEKQETQVCKYCAIKIENGYI